jgi:thiol-disulfide isomerase/thioredoxin
MKLSKQLKSKCVPIIIVIIIASFLWLYMSNTKESFVNTNINSSNSKKTITLCHMINCGHCEAMKPEWEKLRKKYENDINIKVDKIEASEDPTFMDKYDIKGFPTILLNSNGKVKTFEGDRTFKAINSFLLAN